MGQDSREQQERRDFLISYNDHDITWAEWIGVQVEQAGYSVFLLAWDGRPGNNLILSLDSALRSCQRCLLVLSPAYLQEGLTQAQWAAVFRQDPVNEHRTLLPMKVEDCQPAGFLATHNPIDLYGLEETEATERLLAFLAADRLQPSQSIAGEAPRKLFYPGSPVTWNLPYRRNPYFTGQEEYLSELHTLLWENQRASVTQTEAISGLGGVGKTQLAVEYAYRYRADYTHVFWVQADTQESLVGSYSEIAHLLQLPECVEQAQSLMVAAVMRWLQQHRRYLLILDNADDLALVQPFLPTACPGHVVLTTRTQHVGRFAQRLEIDTLKQEVGAALLLRRAGLIGRHTFLEGGTTADQALALTLTAALGGLPLALDQAGAYIEATQCSLAEYQQAYHEQRRKLLALRNGPPTPGALRDDHPEPVATTWSLSFAKVELASPIAAEVLWACAFLAPDAIPEELLVEVLNTSSLLMDKQQRRGGWFSRITSGRQKPPKLPRQATSGEGIQEAVTILRSYSLLQRDTGEKLVRVHRLVQAVVRDALEERVQEVWMTRIVRAVDRRFPEVSFETWGACERYLPHVLACYEWIVQRQILGRLRAALLNRAAWYLGDRARYAEAEPLYMRALAISEKQLGAKHFLTASILNNLALLYQQQGKYVEAEPLYVRALSIREKQLGAKRPDAARILNNLALLYQQQGKYVEAEPLLVRALAISEKRLGAEHSYTALSLNNLASLYSSQGKYVEAESLYVRTLAISEKQLGSEHPNIAGSLNNLALLYQKQGKYVEAEPLYVRTLAISEKQLGSEHPNTALSLSNLALLYQKQGKYMEAEPLYVRALSIRKKQLGTEHPDTALNFDNLAGLYFSQEKYAEAEPLYVWALAIKEKQLGSEHPDTALSLNNLAYLYKTQGKYAEAKPLYVRALAISENTLGQNHPSTRTVHANYAAFWKP